MHPRRLLPLTVLLALALGAFSAPAREEAPESTHDERLLRDAGIATDAAGLVAFFRSRTPSVADQSRLSERVLELGANAFAVRERASKELTAGGRFALPLLRQALHSEDLEVVRRAARCIEEIEQAPTAALITSASRLAAVRKPADAAEALLALLPWVDDESAEEAVFQSLASVGLKEGVAAAAVVRAAADKASVRRAAAGFVLGQASPAQRTTALRLLQDADARVRFQAALGLLRAKERAAVPALIGILTDGPPALTWQAEEVLGRLAGEHNHPSATVPNDAEARRRARQAWETWWKSNEAKVDLGRATREEEYLGLNLVIELDGAGRGGQGRVWECGSDGKARWQIEGLNRPIDAQLLAGGRVLVAEHGAQRVSERQLDGKTIWEMPLSSQPVSCQRLPNGNTFIATYNELLEVTREKAVVFSHKKTAMIYFGHKLRNGHVVYVTSANQVIELDAAGKEINCVTIENTGGWASVELQPNGNYLVALYNAKKVVEVDRAGKVLWECLAEAPGHATRLRNGNTLVASIEGRRIAEFDRLGKEIWSQKTTGRPFHAYRR